MAKIGKKEAQLKEQREQTSALKKIEAAVNKPAVQKALAKPSLKAVQAAKARAATFKAPSPKSQLLEALVEIAAKPPEKRTAKEQKDIRAAVKSADKLAVPKNGEIPPFLKRTETPEQAEARRKKQARADHSAGVTLAPPLSVQKAIENELRDDDPPRKKKQTIEDVKQAARVEVRTRLDAITKDDKVVDHKTQEAKVKKASKKNGKKPVSDKTKKKVESLLQVLAHKNGATNEDIIKACGARMSASTMRRACETHDRKLKIVKKEGEPTRYSA